MEAICPLLRVFKSLSFPLKQQWWCRIGSCYLCLSNWKKKVFGPDWRKLFKIALPLLAVSCTLFKKRIHLCTSMTQIILHCQTLINGLLHGQQSNLFDMLSHNCTDTLVKLSNSLDSILRVLSLLGVSIYTRYSIITFHIHVRLSDNIKCSRRTRPAPVHAANDRNHLQIWFTQLFNISANLFIRINDLSQWMHCSA